MVNYLLVENRTIIHLDMPWRTRFIQSELDDLGVSYVVPQTESGYIKINDSFELIPVTITNIPEFDQRYEHLTGPVYVYHEDYAEKVYSKADNLLEDVKREMKYRASLERYKREVSGKKTTINSNELTLDTSRENRNNLVQKYISMEDNETVNWKFPESWVVLTKAQIGLLIKELNSHVQTHFDWELNKINEIENCSSSNDLMVVEIEPIVTTNRIMPNMGTP